MRDTEREAETQAEGEAGSMQKPDMGLNPGSLGSGPGLKAALNPLSHPEFPSHTNLEPTGNTRVAKCFVTGLNSPSRLIGRHDLMGTCF